MIYWQCLFKYAGILLVFTATNANYPVLVLQVCFPPVLDAIEDSSQLRIRHYEEARTVTAFTILFLLQCFVVDLTGSQCLLVYGTSCSVGLLLNMVCQLLYKL